MPLILVATVGSTIGPINAMEGAILTGEPTVFVGGVPIAVAGSTADKHTHYNSDGHPVLLPATALATTKTVFAGESLVHRVGDSRSCSESDSLEPPIHPSFTTTTTTATVFCGD